MKNQKGSAAVWVIVVLILIIIAGAAYWYLTQNQTQPLTVSTTELQTQPTTYTPSQPSQTTQAEPATEVQQTNVTVSDTNTTSQSAPVQNNSSPSATIDQSSLTSATTPKLTGNISGTSQITVAVWQGNLSPSQMTLSANNMPFWSSNTEIRDPEVSITNGRWSTAIGNSEVAGLGAAIPYFPNGTYTVSVTDENTREILTSGTLKITGPSIDVTNANTSTVTFSFADLPENSQVLLAGQSSNPPVVATVSGSGSDSISISGGLQGTYWLQVELNGNANTTLQSGPFSANYVGH